MSTYTQDITHLIGKINTNLPDNDTQAITAARIRDAMGAVAYNYDLYVLKSQLNQELGSYVLKTDLDTAGYVTASQLEGLATEQELQEGMQTVHDDAYAYVVEKINEIPGVDLSAYVTKSQLSQELGSYVTKTELSEMGYITENDLPDMSTYVSQDDLQSALEPYVTESQLQQAGYATKTYVADYVATHSGPIDLSAYVTKSQLQTELSAYVTKDELSAAGYLTAVPSEYITDTELSGMGYITSSALGDYVTETELSQAGYLTSIPSEYVTESEIATMGYITDTELSNVLSTASYVTQNELSNAGYITNSDLSQASYVTQQALSAMGYITSSALSGLATETYVADYVAEHAPMPDLSAYVTKTELSAAGYLTAVPSEYITDTELSSMGYITEAALGDYVTETELSQAGYITETELGQVLSTASYVTQTELSNAGYITNSDLSQASYVTQQALSGMGYLTAVPSEYVTENELSNIGYVTQTDLSAMSYATTSDLTSKQDTLVSGTNIKTINNESLLGSGNIDIQAGGPTDYSHVLTFTADQANSSVTLNRMGSDTSLTNAVLQYSTDNGETWSNYTLGTSIALAAIGDAVKFKGTNAVLGLDSLNYHKFTMTGKISASGDITSLFNETGGDIQMLAYGCYYLFFGCTSLTAAPKLPSTTLGANCYVYMFYGCTSLTEAPELPATTLAIACYNGMFNGCTYLTKAPKLPATTLANNCYDSMFRGCTRLTTAPDLPATTLAYGCYSHMFNGCTSLTKAPELPATTLVVQCYSGMFYKCSSLKYIKAMFTSTPAAYLNQNWVYNVAATGVFVKNNAATWTTTGADGVPSGWTVYKTVALDTDDVPESYVEDEGKTLQVVNGLWTKVTGGGGDMSAYVTKTELSAMGYATTTQLSAKQDTLVSGTNIKTINNTSLLGSGDITISGGSSITAVTQAEYDAMEQAGTLDPDTLYIISDAQSADLDDYVTKTELSNAGYLTSANLIYDSTTNTLTINV